MSRLVPIALACVTIMSVQYEVTPAAQLLPTPRDGDIRTVYWELQNRSELFLTLELQSADRKPAPLVTLSLAYAGKSPPTRPTAVELRAYAGNFWAPRGEFWVVLDDTDKIDLVPEGWWGGLVTGAASDYLPVTISMEILQQIAVASGVKGNALGFDFELSDSQRQAIRAFRDRITNM